MRAGLAATWATVVSLAWPAANQALYLPFYAALALSRSGVPSG